MELEDDPSLATEVIWEGLDLVPFVVIPHADDPELAAGAKESDRILKAEGFETYLITNAQAVLVHGEDVRVVG